jgi:hypothetical protein
VYAALEFLTQVRRKGFTAILDGVGRLEPTDEFRLTERKITWLPRRRSESDLYFVRHALTREEVDSYLDKLSGEMYFHRSGVDAGEDEVFVKCR